MVIPWWSGTFDKTIVNKPIKFVGTGEKWMQLMCSIPFVWPKELRNGRCCVLVERAQEQFDEEEN
jgi:signal recognition particle GTPase